MSATFVKREKCRQKKKKQTNAYTTNEKFIPMNIMCIYQHKNLRTTIMTKAFEKKMTIEILSFQPFQILNLTFKNRKEAMIILNTTNRSKWRWKNTSLLFSNYQRANGMKLKKQLGGKPIYYSENKNLKYLSFIHRLHHNMKIIGRMDSIMILIITTSKLRTSKLVYNLRGALIYVWKDHCMLLSYRSVHDTFWKYISIKSLPVSSSWLRWKQIRF